LEDINAALRSGWKGDVPSIHCRVKIGCKKIKLHILITFQGYPINDSALTSAFYFIRHSLEYFRSANHLNLTFQEENTTII
jgi:hypothetical protein